MYRRFRQSPACFFEGVAVGAMGHGAIADHSGVLDLNLSSLSQEGPTFSTIVPLSKPRGAWAGLGWASGTVCPQAKTSPVGITGLSICAVSSPRREAVLFLHASPE